MSDGEKAFCVLFGFFFTMFLLEASLFLIAGKRDGFIYFLLLAGIFLSLAMPVLIRHAIRMPKILKPKSDALRESEKLRQRAWYGEEVNK